MNHVAVPARKSDDVARHDREVGGALAFGVFLVVVVALVIALKKIRRRVMVERADRELRDEIDRLEDR